MPKTKLARKLTIGTAPSNGNHQIWFEPLCPVPQGTGFFCVADLIALNKPSCRILKPGLRSWIPTRVLTAAGETSVPLKKGSSRARSGCSSAKGDDSRYEWFASCPPYARQRTFFGAGGCPKSAKSGRADLIRRQSHRCFKRQNAVGPKWSLDHDRVSEKIGRAQGFHRH